MIQIKQLPPHRRPREKLLEKGPAALSDAELLALLLRTGVSGRSAVDLAKQILAKIPLSELSHSNLNDLKNIRGLGLAKSTQVLAAFELAKRIGDSSSQLPLNQPERVVNLLNHYRSRQKEYFLALYLNARHRLLAQEEISVGHLTASLVHPREVFKPAIQLSAAFIILAHNHPSGDPQPSHDDLLLTQRLVEAGQLLDIAILDHLIITKDSWCSLKQLGHI